MVRKVLVGEPGPILNFVDRERVDGLEGLFGEILVPHKTIYEYDALGRTVKVTPPPGNQGFTSYEYGGTAVKTIDPKGKWKKFENDSQGNVVKVTEPLPALRRSV